MAILRRRAAELYPFRAFSAATRTPVRSDGLVSMGFGGLPPLSISAITLAKDIHSLIKAIDNVADNMHGAASRMRLYQVEKITKSIRKLTEINLEACQLIGTGIKELKDMNHKAIKETCKKINKLESKADVVFDKAVADIFENETDAKSVIKYKEVLSALEMASDKCKSVSNVMEQISVKHS